MKYILVKQHDENDCGVACLAMLSQFYGSNIRYRKIKELVNSEKGGISIEELVEGAENIGFKAKALKGSLKELQQDLSQKKIRLPFIAHTINSQNIGHYVVVYSINKKKVVIGNPNGSLEKKPLKAFEQTWTGFIMNLKPTNGIKKETKENILKKNIAFYLKKNKILIAIILLISGISLFFDFVCSQVISYIVDRLSNGSINNNFINQIFQNNFLKTFSIGAPSMSQIIAYCIGAITFGMLEMFIMFFSKYLKSVLNKRIDSEIMNAYYTKLLNAPLSFYERTMSGDLMSRFYDIAVIKNMIIALSLELSVSIITFLLSGIFLALVSRILFGIIILILFLYLLTMLLYNKSLTSSAKNALQDEAQLTSCIKETIAGIDIIKYNTCESYFHAKFQQFSENLLNSIQRNSLLGYSQESLNSWITFMGNVLILGIGIYLCIYDYITIGILVSFMYIMYFFLNPIQKLADFQGAYKNGMIALARLNDIIEIPPKYSGNMIFPEFDVLEYKNVKFKYATGEFGLKNINLNIERGQDIAIVGKSGCGKTSLVKLLVGEVSYEGNIMLGKTNLLDIQLMELRHKIVYLPQKSLVFSGTIRDNIILGRENISEEHLNKICEICFTTEFNHLPKRGLDMLVAENGINLSGGQIQRIALARAVLNTPDILILDEATSNLDLYSEEIIIKKLRSFLSKTTIIIITHRLHYLESYDNILFMENGKIVMQGTHNKLMEQSVTYSNFIKRGDTE